MRVDISCASSIPGLPSLVSGMKLFNHQGTVRGGWHARAQIAKHYL
jgi:hypothetical protein